MKIQLDPIEARIIGCLLEKSVTTPDQYPLTLNALVTACNQKTSRDPVMALEPAAVQRAVRMLEDRRLVVVDENFRSRVEKYDHRFCNTPFADLQLSKAEFAVICLLLLRGPQTPGELRTRSGRLFSFADNAEVAATLSALMQREGGPVVARLPKAAGRQDHEYMHLFSGELETVAEDSAPVAVQAERSRPARTPESSIDEDRLSRVEQRLAALEAQLAELRTVLGSAKGGGQ